MKLRSILSALYFLAVVAYVPLAAAQALPIAELEVAWFAAAMETGCLILLLSKSTDKYFQPHISIMLEREAWDEGAKMRRRRLRWIGSACAAFLLLVFSLGKPILRLYGEPFEAGYPALCLIAIGACAWTMFSLAPAYLKFVGQSRFVFAATVCGAVAMAGLTGLLGIWHGATGAAGAFCIVLCSLAVTNLVHANRHFPERRQAADDQ